MSPLSRRNLLRIAGLAPIAGFVAAPCAAHALPPSPADTLSPDRNGRREPASTTVRTIDGTGVLFQYGAVVPSFDGWRQQEPTRDHLDLDGSWRFRFDPDADGVDHGWHRPDHDDSDWDTIDVPSAWDLHDTPGFESYDGSRFGQGTAFADGFAWYRTTVDVQGRWASRHVRLNFLAVNYRADVWVNGRYVGAHEGGHMPFALPVDRALRPGRRNLIAVRVHRRASYEDYLRDSPQVTDEYAIPWKPVDYWPYAGITRSAWLEGVPRVAIAKVLLAARDGVLDARVVVENRRDEAFTGQVTVDPGTGAAPVTVRIAVGAGDTRVASASVPIPGAQSWGPGHPVVYTATATLHPGGGPGSVDQLRSTYGVRAVDVADGRLLVNGEPVLLKGMNWHEESGANGRGMTIDEYDHELGHILLLGADFIRNTVYNRHPYVYDWADEHGVHIMDDTDNMWINTAQERLQTEQYGLSRALAATMAWNQHNHPSVLMWCLQNESEIDASGAPVYRAWIADMKDAVTALDIAARPVTWASTTTFDPAFDLADVIGFNEYFGYFYGVNSDLGPAIDDVHRRFPNRPIVITENGSWSLAGNHGPETEQGTEEWQAMNLRAHWEQVVDRPEAMAGYVFWVLKDYKQRAGYNREYNGISAMGLLAFDSTTEKLAYDTFRGLSTDA